MDEIQNEEHISETRSTSDPCVRAGAGHRPTISDVRGYSIHTDARAGLFTSLDAEGFVVLKLHDRTIRGWNHDREDLAKLIESEQSIFLVSEDSEGNFVTKYRTTRDGEVVSTGTVLLAATQSPCQTRTELHEQQEDERKRREAAIRAEEELEEALRDLFPVDPSGRLMVSVGEISLTLECSGTWAVARSGRLVERFDDAESALIEFETLGQESDGRIVWHSDEGEILELLTEEGFETFLVDHSDGLVSVDGWWIPADLHPFYGGNYETLPVRAVIEFGTTSDTWYEWDGGYLVLRWEAEGDTTISVEFSLPSNDELEAGFREDSNAFEHYIGLDNLAISDRPTDIVLDELRHEFFLTSYWGYGSYEIAELRVATDTERTLWHVIDTTRNRIVGTYSSLEDLERSVVEETGLLLFAEIHEPSRQREWIPSGQSLAAVLAGQAE